MLKYSYVQVVRITVLHFRVLDGTRNFSTALQILITARLGSGNSKLDILCPWSKGPKLRKDRPGAVWLHPLSLAVEDAAVEVRGNNGANLQLEHYSYTHIKT